MERILSFFKILEIGQKITGSKSGVAALATVLSFVITALTLVTMLDSKYALAKDLKETQQSTKQIVDYLKMQAITRKTILEIREAAGTITPEEKVELKNLKEMGFE